jgi:hypothetical protein
MKMKISELLNVFKKWSPIIDELNSDPEIDVEKLTKKEKMCLYAHYHDISESVGGGMTTFDQLSDESRLNSTTLPVSLKILKEINNFKNIIIVNAPLYSYYDKNIRAGNIYFTRQLSEILRDPDESFKDKNTNFSLEDLDGIEKYICSITAEYINKLVEENENKKIFLYIVVQNIMILDNQKLCWTTRLAVE